MTADHTATTTERLAAAFHETMTEVTVALVERAARIVGDKPVCVSGCLWQNRRLTRSVVNALSGRGFDVYINQRIPCNDGGLSYGQAAIAAAMLAER